MSAAPEYGAARDADLSFWLAEALAGDSLEPTPLIGDERADVCIVGGGFTGLWTALGIKRADPAARVTIVERGVCGSGASGRNGGFALSLWAKFLPLERLAGRAEAVRLARASSEAVKEIGAFCNAHGLADDYAPSGWLWSATSEAQRDTWAETLDAIEAAGHAPFETVSDARVRELGGSPRHRAGVLERVAARVQPARLAFALRRAALEAGVAIYERTPMTRLVRGTRPVVQCARGAISAGTVVLATNAWGVAFPEIRRAIAVVSSDVVATAPRPDLLARIGWDDGPAVSDSRMLVHYYRTTPDGRIVFGKGGGSGTLAFGGTVDSAFDGASPIAATVTDELRATYPAFADVPIAQSWTGPIDRSSHGLPVFGRLPGCPQVLYGVGYSGNGVGPSVLGGKILTSLALERRDAWSECGLVQSLERAFPPEPFRYVGGKLVRAAIARRDRALDAGRPVGPVVRALAGLAPAGLSPIRRDDDGAAPVGPETGTARS